MNLEELAKCELELYKKVCSLEGSMEEKDDQLKKLGIYNEYTTIHREYAKQSKDNIEALKRGLFLIWYSMVEPSCFIGIKELDPEAERKIIDSVDSRIKRGNTDYELDWMLDYYSGWDFVFERFNNYRDLQGRLKDELKTELPTSIDREEMEKRGQMGLYWNSLAIFSKRTSN